MNPATNTHRSPRLLYRPTGRVLLPATHPRAASGRYLHYGLILERGVAVGIFRKQGGSRLPWRKLAAARAASAAPEALPASAPLRQVLRQFARNAATAHGPSSPHCGGTSPGPRRAAPGARARRATGHLSSEDNGAGSTRAIHPTSRGLSSGERGRSPNGGQS